MVNTLESTSPRPNFPALTAAPAPVESDPRDTDVPVPETVSPSVPSQSPVSQPPDKTPDLEPPTMGEIVRRALLTSHFVHAALVPSALARALRKPPSDEPSQLDLRA